MKCVLFALTVSVVSANIKIKLTNILTDQKKTAEKTKSRGLLSRRLLSPGSFRFTDITGPRDDNNIPDGTGYRPDPTNAACSLAYCNTNGPIRKYKRYQLTGGTRQNIDFTSCEESDPNGFLSMEIPEFNKQAQYSVYPFQFNLVDGNYQYSQSHYTLTKCQEACERNYNNGNGCVGLTFDSEAWQYRGCYLWLSFAFAKSNFEGECAHKSGMGTRKPTHVLYRMDAVPETPSPTTRSPTSNPTTPEPTPHPPPPTPFPTPNPTPQPTPLPTPVPTPNPTPQPTNVPTTAAPSSPTLSPTTAAPTPPPTPLVLPSDWTSNPLQCYYYQSRSVLTNSHKLFGVVAHTDITAYTTGDAGQFTLSLTPQGHITTLAVDQPSQSFAFITSSATDLEYDPLCGPGATVQGTNTAYTSCTNAPSSAQCMQTQTPFSFTVDRNCWSSRGVTVNTGEVYETTNLYVHYVQCVKQASSSSTCEPNDGDNWGTVIYNAWKQTTATFAGSTIDYTMVNNVFSNTVFQSTSTLTWLKSQLGNDNEAEIISRFDTGSCFIHTEEVQVEYKLPSVTSTALAFDLDYVYYPVTTATGNRNDVVIGASENNAVDIAIDGDLHMTLESCYHSPQQDPSSYSPFTDTQCATNNLYRTNGYLFLGQPFRIKFKFVEGTNVDQLFDDQLDFSIANATFNLYTSGFTTLIDFDIDSYIYFDSDNDINTFWVYGKLGSYQDQSVVNNAICSQQVCNLQMRINIDIETIGRRRLFAEVPVGIPINKRRLSEPSSSFFIYDPAWVHYSVQLHGSATTTLVRDMLYDCASSAIEDKTDISATLDSAGNYSFVIATWKSHVQTVENAVSGCFRYTAYDGEDSDSDPDVPANSGTDDNNNNNKLILGVVLGLAGLVGIVVGGYVYYISRDPEKKQPYSKLSELTSEESRFNPKLRGIL